MSWDGSVLRIRDSFGLEIAVYIWKQIRFFRFVSSLNFCEAAAYEKNELLGEGFRLRTMKFRGQISQGLVQPLSILPEGNV